MDRYKEGYNDCNRDWKKKIEKRIKELDILIHNDKVDEEYIEMELKEERREELKSLLKKG